jgi:CDP-diacylglycerol---serine O-phosphatidyltransferase
MKQIPNLFTLLNLIFGCIAIVLILQTGESIISMDEMGATMVSLPERIWQGSIFIFAAAIIDFLDGFLARLLKAPSEMGKQLDSLSDVVSFGVAPGMILYQLLRISYAREENGLDITVWVLLPAFIYTAAAAWRLAKFNISSNQSHSFRGVPSPAAGLLVASFPLIIWFTKFQYVQVLLINKWLLYGVILALAYLMTCDRTFMAIKFKDYSLKNNRVKYLLVVVALISIIFLQWLAVPVIFILYLIISTIHKEKDTPTPLRGKEELDITS